MAPRSRTCQVAALTHRDATLARCGVHYANHIRRPDSVNRSVLANDRGSSGCLGSRLPAAFLAHHPRDGTGMPARAQRLPSPRSDMPYRGPIFVATIARCPPSLAKNSTRRDGGNSSDSAGADTAGFDGVLGLRGHSQRLVLHCREWPTHALRLQGMTSSESASLPGIRIAVYGLASGNDSWNDAASVNLAAKSARPTGGPELKALCDQQETTNLSVLRLRRSSTGS
jgi:hypothetical protein